MADRASVADVIALCAQFLATPGGNPIADWRLRSVGRIKDALAARGYPDNEPDQLELSIVPFVFQEANYDGIDWADRDSARLFQLREMLDIDFLTQMAGLRR